MVSDGASVASCCILHGYSRTFIAGGGIVFKPMDMFPCCLDHEFQPDSKIGSMGGISGQRDHGHHLHFRYPEHISLDIMKKGSQPTRLEANSHTRL